MHMAVRTHINVSTLKRRILVVDDHPIVRYGITRLINKEEDMEVCGEASDGNEALRLLAILKPNLVIVDISLPVMDGLRLTQIIRAEYPSIPVIILSMHDENSYGRTAVKYGARGYLSKEECSEKLIDVIRKVLRGELAVSDAIRGQIFQDTGSSGKQQEGKESPFDTLSYRERQIFLSVGRGFTSAEIARQLGISPKSVETYRQRVKIKLGFDSNHKLVVAASRWSEKENLDFASH